MTSALFAIINEGGNYLFEESFRRLSALFPETNGRVVVLRFCRGSEQLAAEPAIGGIRVETIFMSTPFGYGDQVKLAFELAARLELDVVVAMDGQLRYPLDDLPALLDALHAGGADLVVASPTGETAIIGAGAWLASRVVNLLTRTRFSVWHPGFRAYRVAALRGIPYAKNVEDRGFNTEIIIQFLIADRAIARVATRGYGHDTLTWLAKCRLAWGMLKAAGLSLLHHCSLFYQPQFDLGSSIETYALKLGYTSSHSVALAAVPPGARVLDIGCGNGAFDQLLMDKGCQVHGLDKHSDRDVTGLDAYTAIDLDVQEHAFPAEGFDCVLLLDVLEHLRHPESLLEYLRVKSGPHPKPLVLISVPNVAFFIIRLRLLFGSFHYGKLGILDLTHTRLFTQKSILSLLARNGYTVESVTGIPAPYPKAIGNNIFSRLLLAVNRGLIAVNQGLFSYQLLISVRPKPILDDLLPPPSSSAKV